MSRLGRLYIKIYSLLCGVHPDLHPWHFQWLFMREVHIWQRREMASFSGHVLDVGCGEKPYASWVNHASGNVTSYTGLDVYEGPQVDIVVKPDETWPLEDVSVDCILFAQVFEHVADREHIIKEISRVLKPNGRLLLTVPFLMPAHGLPYDYARFTIGGIRSLFEEQYDIEKLSAFGRAGSVIGTMILSWLESLTNHHRITRILKGPLLPLWLIFSALINMACLIVNMLDTGTTLYTNVGMIATRKVDI